MIQKISWGKSPLFVGTVVTRNGLKLLAKDQIDADLVEVRVDALLAVGVNPERIMESIHHRKHPVILTLRTQEEGGRYEWAKGEREALFTAFMTETEVIDLELASLKELKNIVPLAKKSGVQLILSAHSIQKPASPAQFRKWLKDLLRLKPSVAKIASQLASRKDLITLAKIVLEHPKQRWALMGLGPLAALSRVILGSLGSNLVYGYLDQPVAPGQPAVKRLRENELSPFVIAREKN